jgi:hypothetical protein
MNVPRAGAIASNSNNNNNNNAAATAAAADTLRTVLGVTEKNT